METYLNSVVNDRVEKPVAKKSKGEKTKVINLFWGLGRFDPLNFIKPKNQPDCEVKDFKPMIFRGLGKDSSYSRVLKKTYSKSSSSSEKRLKYWRGLRPRSSENKTSSKEYLQKSDQKSLSQSVKSYNYWRGLRPGAFSSFWKFKSYSNGLQKMLHENSSQSVKKNNYWRGLRPNA